jgi:hypothetical protein
MLMMSMVQLDNFNHTEWRLSIQMKSREERMDLKFKSSMSGRDMKEI